MFSVGSIKEDQKCYTMHMVSKSLHCRMEINFACIFAENLYIFSFCRADASHHSRNLSSGKAISWVSVKKMVTTYIFWKSCCSSEVEMAATAQ